MGNILEVSGLNKSYAGFSLTDVGFALPEGCITGFIGINGAGKTTTIRAILGLAKKDSGAIRIFGEDFDGNEQEIKNRIGVVLDEGYFYDDMTIAEMKNVIAPSYTQWSDSDYKENMDKFSLNPRQKIATLSRGMRMKFALTLALSHKAELLIMDEPTSGLDPLIRSELLEMMADFMNGGGKAVSFSTHITSDLEKIADMIILIHDGKVLFEKERDWLFDNYRLIKGDSKTLTENNRDLFLSIHATGFGFTALTDNLQDTRKIMPEAIIERPTIEDIMLAHIERR